MKEQIINNLEILQKQILHITDDVYRMDLSAAKKSDIITRKFTLLADLQKLIEAIKDC